MIGDLTRPWLDHLQIGFHLGFLRSFSAGDRSEDRFDSLHNLGGLALGHLINNVAPFLPLV